MKESNGLINKILGVIISNVIKLISSVLVGFIIPILLDITDFGYYKIFALYLTYCGLLHFGFIDGIYLLFAGKNYNELNHNKFAFFTRFIFILESIIATLGIVFSLIFLSGEYKFIFTLLSINLIALNLTTYYQYISQITNRFKEYSIRLIILSITNIIIVGIMYLGNLKSYTSYIILLVISNYLLCFWYMWTYRDITFKRTIKDDNNIDEIIKLFKLGIPLLLANFIAVILMSIDKLIIEIFFDIETFGIYSFAYNLVNIIVVIVGSIGVVLYPFMSKFKSNIYKMYSPLNAIIIVIISIGLISYFPLQEIIRILISKYIPSLDIFRIIMPGILITSVITIIKQNYYKIYSLNIMFLIFGTIGLVVTTALDIVAFVLFKDSKIIAMATVLGLFIWYLIVEIFIARKFKAQWIKNLILTVFVIISFYSSTLIHNIWIGGAIYSISVLITGIALRKEVLLVLRGLVKRNGEENE